MTNVMYFQFGINSPSSNFAFKAIFIDGLNKINKIIKQMKKDKNGEELLRSLKSGFLYNHYGRNNNELNSIKSEGYRISHEVNRDESLYFHGREPNDSKGNGERNRRLSIYFDTYKNKASGNDQGWSSKVYKDEDD